jgi:hypothetical protein
VLQDAHPVVRRQDRAVTALLMELALLHDPVSAVVLVFLVTFCLPFDLPSSCPFQTKVNQNLCAFEPASPKTGACLWDSPPISHFP